MLAIRSDGYKEGKKAYSSRALGGLYLVGELSHAFPLPFFPFLRTFLLPPFAPLPFRPSSPLSEKYLQRIPEMIREYSASASSPTPSFSRKHPYYTKLLLLKLPPSLLISSPA